jgi:hypothetical protein
MGIENYYFTQVCMKVGFQSCVFSECKLKVGFGDFSITGGYIYGDISGVLSKSR